MRYLIAIIAIWILGPTPAQGLTLADNVDSEITFTHGGPTTRENVLLRIDGNIDSSTDGNTHSSTTMFDSSLVLRHEYRFGIPGSDFPGFIVVESDFSDFDADMLTVRVSSNTNGAFPPTDFELTLSDLNFLTPNALDEKIIGDVQLLSFTPPSLFNLFPYLITSGFSSNSITVNVQGLRLIGGQGTAVFGITRVPEPSTATLFLTCCTLPALVRRRR